MLPWNSIRYAPPEPDTFTIVPGPRQGKSNLRFFPGWRLNRNFTLSPTLKAGARCKRLLSWVAYSRCALRTLSLKSFISFTSLEAEGLLRGNSVLKSSGSSTLRNANGIGAYTSTMINTYIFYIIW